VRTKAAVRLATMSFSTKAGPTSSAAAISTATVSQTGACMPWSRILAPMLDSFSSAGNVTLHRRHRGRGFPPPPDSQRSPNSSPASVVGFSCRGGSGCLAGGSGGGSGCLGGTTGSGSGSGGGTYSGSGT